MRWITILLFLLVWTHLLCQSDGKQTTNAFLDSVYREVSNEDLIDKKVDILYNASLVQGKSSFELLAQLSLVIEGIGKNDSHNVALGLASEVMANSLYLQGDYEVAIKKYKSALSFFSQNGEIHRSRLLGEIGVAFDRAGFADSSFKYFELQAEEAKRTSDSLSKATATHNIAKYWANKNNAQKSTELYFKALRQIQGCAPSSVEVNILLGIGTSYKALGNHVEASKYYDQALAVSKKIEPALLMHYWSAHVYNQLANPYLTKKDSLKSAEIVDLQWKHALASHSQAQIYSAYLNKAWFFNNLKMFDEGIASYREALQIQRHLKNRRSVGIVHYNLCATYTDMRDFEKAVQHGDSALRIFKEIKDEFWVSWTYYNVGIAYSGWGKYQEAYDAMQSYADLSYEVMGQENSEKIAQLQTAFDVEKKDAAIALLNKENELNDSQRRLLIAISIGLFGIALLGFYLFAQKQKSNKLLSEKSLIIEHALKERETLLKEIHHRVKNNLQIISSLLSLQSKNMGDDAAKDAISESRNRVKSMSLIHEQLYQEEAISGVEMKDYISRLVKSLTSSYGIDMEQIEVNIDSDQLLLDVDSAIPLGLIINELVSNSIKYAFPQQQQGAILISLKEMMNELQLIVKDTGVGLNADTKPQQSFGLNMVNSLMRKLKAEMKVVNDNGTTIELVIRDFKKVNFV